MSYSALKYEIDELTLRHQQEIDLLNLKYNRELAAIKNKCKHKYDDDSSAYVYSGTQRDSVATCQICGKVRY